MQWKRKAKRNKSFKINRYQVIVLALVVLLFILAFLLIKSNIFAIKSVGVDLEKINCADKNSIEKTVDLIGKNIFFINSGNVEKQLVNKFICIKSSQLSKKFPDKVELKVFGREPAAILIPLKDEEASSAGELENFSDIESSTSAESSPSTNFNFSTNSNSGNFVIDHEGVIYSTNIENINAPIVYVNGLDLKLGKRLNGNTIENLLKIIDKTKIFGIGIKDAKMYSEHILLINSTPRIIFRLDTEVDIQIASLQLILNKAKIDNDSLEFIDLRFDKPIVKIAPKKI